MRLEKNVLLYKKKLATIPNFEFGIFAKIGEAANIIIIPIALDQLASTRKNLYSRVGIISLLVFYN